MRYHRLGRVPPKRHTQFREDGRLLVEEVMGFEGFSGNESILYHLQSPCRIADAGEFTPLEREEWVPDAHVHRHTRTAPLEPAGDPVRGRRLLMWNHDVEISLCKPAEEADFFYRNGEGDEVVFVHQGSGMLETTFGRLRYRPGDYVVIPRGTTYRFAFEGRPEDQLWLTFETPGEIETPSRYRNRYGQLLEHAPYSQRDFRPPEELDTHRERGEFALLVRVRGGLQRYTLDYHPFDVVGWDGYVYPYLFNVADFEPRTGRLHLPPPTHQTFQGPNFVICSFCPRELDWDPLAVPIPYHHSNVQSEEMIYYVSGDFASRKGIDVGSITLHPSGLPHGPQPGLVEKSLGARRTEELAVMCDTFRPLRLSRLARELDDPDYAYSWYAEEATTPAATTTG
jgi:homogentisate 1,2-dioxygenase